MSDDFEIVGDAAREARVVAVVLGECSDFEREEVERLCEEHPELLVFRRRVEAVHGLLGESRVQNPESRKSAWKLSPERRSAVLEKLGEKETVVEGPKKERRPLERMAWQVAAVAAVMVIFAGLLVPTRMKSVGHVPIDLAASQMLEEEVTESASAGDIILPASIVPEEEKITKKPSAASSAMGRVIAANKSSPVATPIPGLAEPVREVAFGDGDDYGSGWGGEPEIGEQSRGLLAGAMTEGKALGSAGRGRAEFGFDLEEVEATGAKRELGFPSNASAGESGRVAGQTKSSFDAFGVTTGKATENFDIDPFAPDDDWAEREVGELKQVERMVALQREVSEKEELLEAVRSAANQSETKLVDLATDMHDYKEAEREYESSLAGLNDFKYKHASERVLLRSRSENQQTKEELEAMDGKVAELREEVQAKRKTLETMERVLGRPYFEGNRNSNSDDMIELSTDREEDGLSLGGNLEKENYHKQGGLLAVERIRREAATPQAVELLTEGRRAYAEGDYEQATRLYRESLNILPFGPKTEVKRDEITAHLADGSVALAQQYRRAGKMDEAKELLNEVLNSSSENSQLEESLDYFDDPVRANPSLTMEHSENVNEVRRLLYKAEGFYNLADYDHAEKQLHKVLRIDPYNKAARRWLEKTAAIKSDYYRAAYDQTRAQLLMEVDKAWELTIPDSKQKPKDELGLMSSLFGEEKASTQTIVKAEKGVVDSAALLPPLEGPAVASAELEKVRESSLVSKLEGIVIPSIDFENTPLDEALEYLTQKTLELDPDSDSTPKGVSFLLEPSAEENLEELAGERDLGAGLLLVDDPSQKKIDRLKLENVPLGTALDYITAKTGLRYSIKGGVVTLLPIGSEASADLVTRTWRVSPEAYAQLMKERRQSEFEAEVSGPVSEQEALEESGVSFVEGAEVRYSAENGLLMVRNRVTELDLVDELLENVEQQAQAARETEAMDEKEASVQGDSTFSLHVSDVSFKLAQAALEQGKWPETVRVEEFVNAFSYRERALGPNERVGVAMEQAAHPGLSQRNLLRISLQTAATGRAAGVPLRLTVVLDKSGSMERVDRATAVEEAFRVLVEQLNPGDKVTLVGFSRTPSLLADFVDGAEGERLLQILRETPSEGGTNVEEALKLARAKALEHFQEGAQNRVILLTDGIANLGESVPENLMALVEVLREEGVAFDACGVGVEGVNDDILEALTRKGDGRYYLLGSALDSGAEFAKKVAGALRPAAQNVKVQVEWNPDRVGKWRLYGFEKHELKKEDFRNDSVDAAEMAAEEEGVALYHVEVKPEGEGPLGVARVRFRDVARDEMLEREWEIPYEGEAPRLAEADAKVRLAAVAGLTAEKLARSAVGERVEWDELLETTRQLQSIFPKEKQVKDLETMIEQAKRLQ